MLLWIFSPPTGAVSVSLTITPSTQVQPGATIYLNCEVWTNGTHGPLPVLSQQNSSEVLAPISQRQIDASTILYYKRIENVVTSTCYTCKVEERFTTATACVKVVTTVRQGENTLLHAQCKHVSIILTMDVVYYTWT